MNREFIIRDEANQFCQDLRTFELTPKGHEEFNSDLSSKVFDFSESEDRLIFLYEVHKILDSKLEKHLIKCQYKDKPEKCDINKFYWKTIFFTEQEIKDLNSEYDFKIFRPFVQVDLVKETLVGLSKYQDSAKLFQSALDKLNENRFERNLLDDLRLSLETLLKTLLNNKKSLEKQYSDLGIYLKEKNTSKECNNMFLKLIDYYSKYQNTYVKHHDKVNSEEVDLLINLTSSYMIYLMNK